ncbi:MAG: ATP-binding protein [Chitinispirillales bacterium]|jgi:predicted ATP-dependent endonuclease of OLD family|nr:ATP-binding protein [Chitinispirillales bacterium]
MQLTKIQIKNFRSIKSQTITFDHNCLILIGKNESGKSNILKAIAAVFNQYKVSDKDKRKRIGNEKIDGYYVRAILKLSEKDFEILLSKFQQKYKNIEHIIFSNGKTLRDFIKNIFHEFLIQIDIKKGKDTHYAYWEYDKNEFCLKRNICLIGNSFNAMVHDKKVSGLGINASTIDSPLNMKQYGNSLADLIKDTQSADSLFSTRICNIGALDSFNAKAYNGSAPGVPSINNSVNIMINKPVFINDLIFILFDLVKELYSENPYYCHYWEYSNDFLLPDSIDIESFIKTPSDYLPIENIFALCGRNDIKNEFANALKEDGDYVNLLEQVSEGVTRILRDIWKDFSETSIQLHHNGTEISIKIANKAKYSCEDRSDGFKKMLSILLMLSAQARSNRIGNRDIILINEPEQSLYPFSVRCLRDELLKIAENANIICSTHSPYMIDSECIERHLIVKKEEDVTTISKQKTFAAYSSDELLLRAFGTSIFESLQNKNIVFEGWLDKKLFQKYCSFHKKTRTFKAIGKVHLSGISGVKTLVQLLILANKKFIIVADSDDASNTEGEKFKNDYQEFSATWLSYADTVKNVVTMEDFLSPTYIAKNIKIKFPEFSYDESKSALKNIEFASKNDKNIKQEIKNVLIENLKSEDIRPQYGNFVEHLKEKLAKL